MDNLESYTRRNNIVIHGIPIQDDNNPIAVSLKVCEAIGVKLEANEIDAAHRLPKSKKLPETTPPPFIMKLVSRFKKEEIVSMAKERQPTAETLGGNVQTRIFFNDDLTRKNSEIKFEAKRLWNGYFVWSRRGKIYAREKSEDGKPTTIHQINSKEDVNTLERE